MSYQQRSYPKKTFEPKADSGTLQANDVKKGPMSPDYWGEIAIDMKNTTAVTTQNGLCIFKLSGWKKTNANGKTFLSIAVNRYIPEGAQQATQPQDDVPF